MALFNTTIWPTESGRSGLELQRIQYEERIYVVAQGLKTFGCHLEVEVAFYQSDSERNWGQRTIPLSGARIMEVLLQKASSASPSFCN